MAQRHEPTGSRQAILNQIDSLKKTFQERRENQPRLTGSLVGAYANRLQQLYDQLDANLEASAE